MCAFPNVTRQIVLHETSLLGGYCRASPDHSQAPNHLADGVQCQWIISASTEKKKSTPTCSLAHKKHC